MTTGRKSPARKKADGEKLMLAVNFQEVVHSDPTVNADVAKQAVIRRGTEWTLTRMRL
jgi:hypothetical protein